MRGVNLQEANLTNASLINTDLSQADLQEATLSGAKLVQTNLDKANLSNANLTRACIEDWGITRNTIFEGVKGDYVYQKLDTECNQCCCLTCLTAIATAFSEPTINASFLALVSPV